MRTVILLASLATAASFPAHAEEVLCPFGCGNPSGTYGFWQHGAIGTTTITTTQPGEPATWHLLTKSHGGTVSLIKGLTKHECEYARANVLKYMAEPCQTGVCGHTISPSDIETAECFE